MAPRANEPARCLFRDGEGSSCGSHSPLPKRAFRLRGGGPPAGRVHDHERDRFSFLPSSDGATRIRTRGTDSQQGIIGETVVTVTMTPRLG